jgi:hypothetical protein
VDPDTDLGGPKTCGSGGSGFGFGSGTLFGRGLYGGNKVYQALVYTECIESVFCIILKIEKNRSQNSRKYKYITPTLIKVSYPATLQDNVNGSKKNGTVIENSKEFLEVQVIKTIK